MKDKLTKIIELGIERGYRDLIKRAGVKDKAEINMIVMGTMGVYGGLDAIKPRDWYYPILLSQEFAKAYWGEDGWEDSDKFRTHIKCSSDRVCQAFDIHYTEDYEIPKYCKECGAQMVEFQNPVRTKTNGWAYHLSRAVIADDLIRYYEENK